jgi:hypothetical protein
MHDHLPSSDPARSLNARRRVRESEETVLRRMHRESAAAESARPRGPLVPAPERIFQRPTANAVLALFGMRR